MLYNIDNWKIKYLTERMSYISELSDSGSNQNGSLTLSRPALLSPYTSNFNSNTVINLKFVERLTEVVRQDTYLQLLLLYFKLVGP